MTKNGTATAAYALEDEKYLNAEAAQKEVLDMLANLELDRHRLRIQLAMNGMDGDTKLQTGMTINEAIRLTNKRIEGVETAFAHLLPAEVGE